MQNAYLHYITVLAAKIAAILGHQADANKYSAAAHALAAAINSKYYDASSGAYVDLLQTHLVMPLASGVVPAEHEAKAVDLLEAAIAKTGDHLDTGLTGNYFMTKLFTESGRNDLMMRITNQTSFPSYGYFLAQGYTTWPERWDVDKCCSDTVSKMHGCYNAVGMWFVQGLAGIDVDFALTDGYPIRIQAGVDAGELMWATGARAAPQGLVRSSWAVGAKGFGHNVTIPGNGAARVLIPAAAADDVFEDGKPLPSDVKVLGSKTINRIPYVALGIGAGNYAFSSNWVRL